MVESMKDGPRGRPELPEWPAIDDKDAASRIVDNSEGAYVRIKLIENLIAKGQEKVVNDGIAKMALRHAIKAGKWMQNQRDPLLRVSANPEDNSRDANVLIAFPAQSLRAMCDILAESKDAATRLGATDRIGLYVFALKEKSKVPQDLSDPRSTPPCRKLTQRRWIFHPRNRRTC